MSGSGILPAATNTGLIGHPAYYWATSYVTQQYTKQISLVDSTNSSNVCNITVLGGTTRPSFGCAPIPSVDNTQALGSASYRWGGIYAGTTGVISSGPVVGTYMQETLTTPASSSATCTAGQVLVDASYIYVCTAANTYKRVALTAF